MWSLFEEKEGKKELKPMIFSNGKSQEDVANEIVNQIRNGTKVVFIHGVCGSGKSAIALNVAKELGKASIVVPIKNLQRQYEEDYMNKKFVIKSNKEKLKISMITGRNNHKCLYLQDNKKDIMLTRMKEKDSNLYDIFENVKKEKISSDESCDNFLIPCKIEIKEKNISTLKKYYKENPEAGSNNDLDLKTMKRFAVAPACPYWCPIINSEKKVKINGIKKTYKSIAGEHSFYLRKNGCSYYNQFNSYCDSDVIIFNSDQYLLETALGRKPSTEVEIIDECDEFLDHLSVEGSINLDKLRNELTIFKTEDEKERKLLSLIIDDINSIINEARRNINSEDIVPVDKTGVMELIKSITHNDLFYENRDEESYIEHAFEVAKDFYPILEDVYVSFSQDRKKDTYAKLVTVNLDKMLKSIIDKNKSFVFMSGTIHSERVLKEVFGLDTFKIIDAEIINQGTITRVKTGLEKDFSYDNFKNNRVTREEYLRALDKCVEISKKPVVIHVNAFQDLPSPSEILDFKLKNLVSSEELMQKQKEDKNGNLVYDFKHGKTNILFTTRCNRGIDFPFETCNSVIITKFPYPNTQSLFWRVLKKNKPNMFWDFYKDKAHRELLQRIYRSVRANDDHVFLLSPDIRVLNSKVI